jgi:DAACS family dicarboxylate/amino acid:cation (Na+ or H+) symporter
MCRSVLAAGDVSIGPRYGGGIMVAHRKMLLGIAVGAGGGLLANATAANTPALTALITYVSDPLGQIFLRLLIMLVVPIIFSALVVGVCELELRQVGRLGARTLGYTVVVSAIAVVLGLLLVNLLEPGRGAGRDELLALASSATAPPASAAPSSSSPIALLVNVVPSNPFQAAASSDIIAIIFFSLAVGVALSVTPTPAATHLRLTIQGLYDVFMRLIEGVLRLAPLGVGALLFTMTARLGTSILAKLAFYVGTVVLGLGLHMFVVYSLSVWLLGGRSPRAFFRDVRLAMVTAFSTASSSATLPTALKVAEENLRLPRHVSRFVLTAGSTMNQNGTALFEGVTVLFLAQLYGVELALSQQAIIMAICILAGIGTAGVPAGSIPVVAMILGLFDIPVQGLGLILGVDRILDMCRTTINVTGDLAAAVYVARGEPDDAAAPPTAPVTAPG